MLEDKFAQHDKIPGDTFVNPTSDYQMRTWDYRVRPAADATSGPITITLPPVTEAKGRLYSILATEADATNTVTVSDGAISTPWSDVVLNTANTGRLFYSDGLSWFVL